MKYYFPIAVRFIFMYNMYKMWKGKLNWFVFESTGTI
uniref:Uncharacterized protein n=1 Tax=Arundo donax TaxID=35708 RepID=A0A0A9A744_ARUDO